MRKSFLIAALFAVHSVTPALAQDAPNRDGRNAARGERALPRQGREDNDFRRGGGDGQRGRTQVAAPPPQAAPAPAPQVVQQAAPQVRAPDQPRVRMGQANQGDWRGRSAQGTRTPGADWRGNRDGRPTIVDRGRDTPAPVFDRSRDRDGADNRDWRQRDGNRDGRDDNNRDGRNFSGNNGRWDGDRNGRGNDNDGRWNGRDDRRDGNRYNNAYRGNTQNWNRDWRRDNRYDWQRYRYSNRNLFRAPRYYTPYGYNYGYQRFSIGVYLGNAFYSDRYWLNDPYDYRLPPAYGPYRWVRYYNDVLLVDTRNGYVVDVIHDFFW